MFRLTQNIRNLYLRFEGLLGVIFKNLLDFVRNLFGFFANIFGYQSSTQFLESDEAQSVKKNSDKQLTQTVQDSTSKTAASNRRSNPEMDYYLNMAREIKNK